MKLFRLIVIFAAASGAVLPLRAELDGVKAVVNDTVITYSQVQDAVGSAMETLQQQYANQPAVLQQKADDLLRDGLEQLVDNQLILHSFDVEGYRLPDSAVDQMVQNSIRDNFYGSRITMMKTLQAQGMTYDQYWKDIRKKYILQALRGKNISQEVVISPYKVETYYLAHQDDFKVEDEIKLRMIVLNKSSADDTNMVKLAREILTKIKEGAAFTEMASVYSQGSQQHQGGDWGWVERSVLRKDLAAAAFALKPGQVSDVIDTPTACYIMLVEQVRPAHVQPLTEVRDDIEKTIRAQDQAQLEKQWIDSLKAKTFIRYF